ncbi:SIP3 Membrane-anchored lipid-binding protein SIP3 [Candida maltosa Xu316]
MPSSLSTGDSSPDPNVLSSMVKSNKAEKLQKSQHHPHQETLLRHFKLISVNFKEAALDSPSFRSSVNHLDFQITTIEQWLTALTNSFKKIPKYVKEVQGFCNSFLEHLVPTFLQDGIIDQEYTVASMHTTLDGLKTIWGSSLQALNVNTRVLENVTLFKRNQITRYKEVRRQFEECQAKYDKYLSIYMSTSKTKDPVVVMEDAKQLYQNLSKEFNTLLVGLNTELWKNKWNIFAPRGPIDTIKESWDKIQRIQAWNDSYSAAIGKLSSDMLAARKQVEDGCHIQFQPSMNPNDYRSTAINNRTLHEIDEPSVEKHGYLFMKTWTEKSAKPIWVKRWAFIKNGVFGLLILSPSSTFVQESDKIGVLLCNVRYSPNEDRRFCFEIRTSDFTATFQAESLLELKSWMKVFENEKNRVTAAGTGNDGLFTIASSRFPPIISEFASTVNTVIDKELTNPRITNSEGQIITSSSLSGHIEKFEQFFEKYMYFQIPKIHPPFMTDTTKSSIIAYCLTSATAIPNALTANIWGSVNWGLYYLHDTVQNNTDTYGEPDYEMIKFQEERLGNDKVYPDFYPNELVNLDIQMRALFETIIEPGEYCVTSFSCIWSPNSKQELSGRCFVTDRHIYLYMQALGFVALFKGFIGRMVSFEFMTQRNYDIMKIYNVDGVIKMKLFLDDANLIKRKLVYLINNISSDKPKRLRGILEDFAEIEKQRAIEKSDERISKEINQLSKQLSSKKLASEKLLVGGESASLLPNQPGTVIQHKLNFTDEYQLVAERSYAIPPKALFHALLGDNSIVFRGQFSFATTEYLMQKPWRTSEDGTLYRDMILPCICDGKPSELHIEQKVDNMEDNTYYTFTHSIAKLEFVLGSPFTLIYKVVIIAQPGQKSTVYYYSKIVFDRLSIWNPLIKTVYFQIDANKFGKFDKEIKKAIKEIGNHGMIVKAIYLYGKLSHTTEPEVVPESSVIKLSGLYLVKVATGKVIAKSLDSFIEMVKIAVKLVLLLLKSLRMNLFLVLIIIILALLNIFLIGKTTTSYWTVKRANQLAYDYVTKEPMNLKRLVYLQDIQDILESEKNIISSNDSSKTPFETFKQKSFVYNFNDETDWNDYFSFESREVARSLKTSFQDIGIQRHDLLVKLRILKEMENEITHAEYQNWLMSEVQRCDYMNDNLIGQIEPLGEYSEGVEYLKNYCNECKSALL